MALPPGSFFPFDATVAFADEIDLCLRWPDPARPAPAPGWAVSGRAGAHRPGRGGPAHAAGDLRPDRRARCRAARVWWCRARATRRSAQTSAAAPGAGCSAGSTASRSATAARACPPACRPPGSRPARSDSSRRRAASRGSRRGRTVAAVDATLDDVALGLSPAFDLAMGTRGLGLRGGRFNVRQGRLRLTGVVVVPGVRVSGAEGRDGVLRLRVGGRSATPGRVTVSRRGVLRGRLGGRAVRARLASGAAAAGGRRLRGDRAALTSPPGPRGHSTLTSPPGPRGHSTLTSPPGAARTFHTSAPLPSHPRLVPRRLRQQALVPSDAPPIMRDPPSGHARPKPDLSEPLRGALPT